MTTVWHPSRVMVSFFLSLGLLGVLTAAFWLYVRAEQGIALALEERNASLTLAAELRQSSDALTRMARSYTYTVEESSGNLHKGTFAGPEQSWSGPRGKQTPFLMAAVKIDSTAAHETAMKKSAEYVKKNPDMPISYLLEGGEFPNPAWRVIWGTSVGTSNYSIFVDASLGDYLRTMR